MRARARRGRSGGALSRADGLGRADGLSRPGALTLAGAVRLACPGSRGGRVADRRATAGRLRQQLDPAGDRARLPGRLGPP
jgi:hypothetical protein